MLTIKVTIVDWIRFLLTLPLSAAWTHLTIMSCVTSDLFLIIAPFSSKSGQNMIYRQGCRLGVRHREGVNVGWSSQPLLALWGEKNHSGAGIWADVHGLGVIRTEVSWGRSLSHPAGTKGVTTSED